MARCRKRRRSNRARAGQFPTRAMCSRGSALRMSLDLCGSRGRCDPIGIVPDSPGIQSPSSHRADARTGTRVGTFKCGQQTAEGEHGAVLRRGVGTSSLAKIGALLLAGTAACRPSSSLIDGALRVAPENRKTSTPRAPRPVAVEFGGERSANTVGGVVQLDELGEEREPSKPVESPRQRQCLPQCGERTCGSDDCGGSCGTCADGRTCVVGQCICSPDCDRHECGDDGCGGSCGRCGPGQACGDDGRCGWLTELHTLDVSNAFPA